MPVTGTVISSFIMSLLLAGWFIAVLFAPVYVFESGLPQPSDFLILGVCLAAVSLFAIRRIARFTDVFAVLAVMVALFAGINAIHAVYSEDVRFYYSTAYYLFNAAVFCGTAVLFQNDPDRMWRTVRLAIIASLVLEIAMILIFDSRSAFRETGSFNNPNQLGYWSLLTAATLIVLNAGRRMEAVDLAAIGLSAVMIGLSSSRAAVMAFGAIILAMLAGRSLSSTVKAAMIGVTCLSVLGAVLYDTDIVMRLAADHGDPSFLAERGYERLFQNPQYLFFGAGEGAYWRFPDEAGRGIELHSGITSILFSYGIFGCVLFTVFLYSIFRKASLVMILTLAAVMLYGITHQNIRFTGFWIYLAVVYGMTRYQGKPHG